MFEQVESNSSDNSVKIESPTQAKMSVNNNLTASSNVPSLPMAKHAENDPQLCLSSKQKSWSVKQMEHANILPTAANTAKMSSTTSVNSTRIASNIGIAGISSTTTVSTSSVSISTATVTNASAPVSASVPTESTSGVGALLGILNPNLSQNVMISIIEDPIQCGYLLVFCESEHSTENLRFIMEVIRYRERLGSDKTSWKRSWHVIDAERVATESDLPYHWPSTLLEQHAVHQLVTTIWDTFLADKSDTQICMPADVVTNTKSRMSRLDLYGPEVFGEALLDPIKTLQRDILPRFLNSSLCAEMVQRIDSLRHLPTAHSINCPPPTDSIILRDHSLEYFVNDRQFSLDSIMHDRILYVLFLEYLRKSVQSENLLCARMIEIFEELVDSGEADIITLVNHGWLIYRYFVAPGAAFEVSLYSLHKKEVMINLAKPQRNTFAELKKSAMSMLAVTYNAYKFTEDYRKLTKVMRDEKKKQIANSTSSVGVTTIITSLLRRNQSNG